MKHFLNKYHSFVFTILTVIGFEFIAIMNANFGTNGFFVACIFCFIIFIIEAWLSYAYAMHMRSKLPLPHIVDDVKHIHIIQHIFLPLLLFLGIIGFIFFNGVSFSTEIIILISGVTIFSIFQGQRHTFKKEFSFDETMHYLYDAIKIIIFFLWIDILLQAAVYFSLPAIATFIGADILTFFLLFIIILRKNQLNSAGSIYIFITSLLTATIVILLSLHFSALNVAIIASVIYYLFIGIIHHKINATLTMQIILEYLIIACILLLALRGIS